MIKLLLLLLFVSCPTAPTSVSAQDAAARSQELAAALDKTKHKKKEKKDFTAEVYIHIKNEPAPRTNPAEFSGVYASAGHRLDLRVAADGAAEGTGFDTLHEHSSPYNFTLRDARVQGALLTATKVYGNGQTQDFEAVFVNRTHASGTNPANMTASEKTFGLGFIRDYGSWTSRVFLEPR